MSAPRFCRPLLRSTALALVLGTGLWLFALPAPAQQDKPASREREQLRRSQAALKQAQAQQEALAGEKAALQAQRDQIQAALDKASAQASAQARAGSAEAQRLRGDAARLRAEAERLRQELATEKGMAQQLQQQLDQANALLQQAKAAHETMQLQVRDARREAAERTQSNTALTALLERATQALTQAEGRNRQMHAAGLAALQRYRSKTEADLRAQNEPFLGLRAVEIENEAERLRGELDKHRMARTQ
jgi:chromosome segregation ATPase